MLRLRMVRMPSAAENIIPAAVIDKTTAQKTIGMMDIVESFRVGFLDSGGGWCWRSLLVSNLCRAVINPAGQRSY